MKGFLHILKYNNAVPIAVSLILLGAASTYAATNPEAIISEEQEVISIDNTYIATKNLNKYSPTVEILSVHEDGEFYYVVYELSTIELVDYVWQDFVEQQEMKVAKSTLGNYRDLGEFVTKQLRELIDNELARLKETQVYEKQQVTQKRVTTKYKGIIGGFLDASTETIDGYRPVVKLPKPEPEIQTFARPDPEAKDKPAIPAIIAIVKDQTSSSSEATQDTPEGENDSTGTDTPLGTTTPNTPPQLTILGDNPALVELGGSYTDLGAVVEDDSDEELSVALFLDDVAVESIVIDTSVVGTHVITYEATDSLGAIGQKKRIVEVYDPHGEDADDESSGSSTTSTGTDDNGEDETTTAPATDQTPIVEEEAEDVVDQVEATPDPAVSATEPETDTEAATSESTSPEQDEQTSSSSEGE